MRRPYVLGIAGSPRRAGNSEQLLDALLGGAHDAGAQTRKLVPAEMSILPCSGCNSCTLTAECVLADEMSSVYAEFDAADAIVIASPVYFAGVPGTLKVLIDRMQPYWARTYVLGTPRPARRPGGFLLVRSSGDPYGFTGAEHTIRSVFAVLGIDVIVEEKVAGLDEGDDIGRRPDALASARAHGVQLAGAARGR